MLTFNTIDDDFSVIFLHVPKAAGTTLRRIFDEQYGESAVYEINADPNNPYPHSRTDYRGMPLAEKRRLKIITGHLAFNEGLHYCLDHPYTYITFIRDPLEVMVSSYYFALSRPDRLGREKIVADCKNVEDFITKGYSDNNRFVQYFASYDEGKPGKDAPEWILESAEYNLQKYFSAVGMVDNYDESLILFKRVLGWKNFPFYSRQNITKKRPEIKDLPQKTQDLLREANHLDLKFYDFARKLFEKQVAEQDATFHSEVEEFEHLNGTQGVNRTNDPSQYAKLNFQGESRFKQGDVDGAIEAFKNAISIQPDFPDAVNNLGVVYYHIGRIDDAVNCFQTVLKMEPNNEDAHYNLNEIDKVKADI